MLAYQYLQTLPLMARGEANKVWVVPSDFGSALQGFAQLLGAPGDDGVFRYQPSPVDDNLPRHEDDSAEVADWFSTATDPAIARAVAAAEAEAQGHGVRARVDAGPPPATPPASVAAVGRPARPRTDPRHAAPPSNYGQPPPRRRPTYGPSGRTMPASLRA